MVFNRIRDYQSIMLLLKNLLQLNIQASKTWWYNLTFPPIFPNSIEKVRSNKYRCTTKDDYKTSTFYDNYHRMLSHGNDWLYSVGAQFVHYQKNMPIHLTNSVLDDGVYAASFLKMNKEQHTVIMTIFAWLGITLKTSKTQLFTTSGEVLSWIFD